MGYTVSVVMQWAGRVIRGGNHTIELRGGWAYARVLSGERMALEDGARDAAELTARLTELASYPSCSGVILDIREAPAIAGPKTRRAVGDLCRRWHGEGKPIVFVVGEEPIKHVQFQGIVNKYAPTWGRVMATLEDAMTWSQSFRRSRAQVD